jgi:4-hydroxybenzoate polyprenyltransferase
MPRSVAAAAAVGLLAIALPVAGAVTPLFALILAAYVAQNLVYSTVLKRVPVLDVTSIGVGFVLRALAGVVLVGASVSPWLVACTFLAAVMLGLGKHWGELDGHDRPSASRPGLDGYSPRLVRWLFGTTAATLLATYALYTVLVGPFALVVTIPFACYTVGRFARLVFARGLEQPHELFADGRSVATFVFWGVATLTILYAVPPVA